MEVEMEVATIIVLLCILTIMWALHMCQQSQRGGVVSPTTNPSESPPEPRIRFSGYLMTEAKKGMEDILVAGLIPKDKVYGMRFGQLVVNAIASKYGKEQLENKLFYMDNHDLARTVKEFIQKVKGENET